MEKLAVSTNREPGVVIVNAEKISLKFVSRAVSLSLVVHDRNSRDGIEYSDADSIEMDALGLEG